MVSFHNFHRKEKLRGISPKINFRQDIDFFFLSFFYLETLGNTFLSADFSRTMESEKVCDVLVVFVRVNAIRGNNGHREVDTKRCRNSICNEIVSRYDVANIRGIESGLL